MLEYLRNAADKPLAKVLMFVLIFSFVGWGAAEWIFGGATRDTTLIHVGNADISVQQFNEERSRQLSMMDKDSQRAAYTDPVRASELTKSVMSTLTMNQLALNHAKDMGFVVSDKRIAREIREYPQFQSNGKFTPFLFDMVLQNSGMSEQDFANALRGDILRQMAVGATNVPVAVPEFAVDALYNARYAKRNVKYETVKFGDFSVENPGDEQLQNYYAQNPVVVPEKRSVSYLFVAADMNKPDIYDAGFKKAQQIEDMIISGDSMADAAARGGAKYVKVPAFARGEKISDNLLDDSLVARVFAMDSGNESELLELKNGFAILRVDEIIPQHNAEFADVKKDLIAGWKKSEQRKNAYIKANELLGNAKRGDLSKAVKSATVSRTDGAPLVVLNSVFSGRNGDVILTEDDGAFYIVSVGETVAPKMDVAQKAKLRKEMENMSSRYLQDDFSQFLKRHYKVKVNDKTFNRFIAK